MEQLKFRAWNKELSRMFMVPSREWSLSLHDTGNMILMWCSDGIVDEIPADEVMQFTGMLDMGGADIYEGDVVSAEVNECAIDDESKIKLYTGGKTMARWAVEHVNHLTYTGFRFYGVNRRFNIALNRSAIFNNEITVIGNIHQNPELME